MKRFSHQELQRYLDAQVREIERYKWIESERSQHDIGFTRAALEWSDRYGASFREAWLSMRQVA